MPRAGMKCQAMPLNVMTSKGRQVIIMPLAVMSHAMPLNGSKNIEV